MTAKATTEPQGSATPSETPTNALAHIRVGPPFTSKITAQCRICRGDTKGLVCAIIENTKSLQKKVVHETCLAEKPELLARRESESLESFLA